MQAQAITQSTQDILIVDDNPENLRLLSKILEEEDYRVRISKSGQQALKVIHKKPPDLMLLDIMMPDLDGFEVYEEVKKKVETPFPVIFISAMNFVSQKLKAFQNGAVDYIEKPFYVEEVKARVKSHLTIERQKRELRLKNVELKKIQEKLKEAEKLALVGEVTAKVTHEINNPINFISLGAQSLVEDFQELTGLVDQFYEIVKRSGNEDLISQVDQVYKQSHIAETKEGLLEMANQVNKGAKRVGSLINNLKHNFLSQVEDPEIFNPNVTLAEVCRIVKMLSNKEIEFVEDLKADCDILAVEQSFFQILLNMIKNAEEATPAKGGKLKVSSFCKNEELHLTIENNGKEIDEEEMGKIFLPFYSTKTKQGGTGMGLAIAKELLDEIGARCEVESKAGKTRFNLIFRKA
jgi:signal transduction histidine kinase